MAKESRKPYYKLNVTARIANEDYRRVKAYFGRQMLLTVAGIMNTAIISKFTNSVNINTINILRIASIGATLLSANRALKLYNIVTDVKEAARDRGFIIKETDFFGNLIEENTKGCKQLKREAKIRQKVMRSLNK